MGVFILSGTLLIFAPELLGVEVGPNPNPFEAETLNTTSMSNVYDKGAAVKRLIGKMH